MMDWLHISLNCSDVPRSIGFYHSLFDLPPVISVPKYAKFEIESLRLVFALELGPVNPGGNLNHFGVRLPELAQVAEWEARLKAQQLPVSHTNDVECCGSNQTKFWVSDPDGATWEIYHRHAETNGPTPVVKPRLGLDDSAPRAPTFTHALGRPFEPPTTKGTLSKVQLLGSMNDVAVWEKRAVYLAEVFAAMQPGAPLGMHALVAEASVLDPQLTGPASHVGVVPGLYALLRAVEEAGFNNLRLERFKQSPKLSDRDVVMHELWLDATKPKF